MKKNKLILLISLIVFYSVNLVAKEYGENNFFASVLVDDSIEANLFTGEKDTLLVTFVNNEAVTKNYELLISDLPEPDLIPLNVGNSWSYMIEEPYGNPPTTIRTDSIIDRINYLGNWYYLINKDFQNITSGTGKDIFNDSKETAEYYVWKGIRKDSLGNYYLGNREGDSFSETILFPANPMLGMTWDSINSGTFKRIVDVVDVIYENEKYFNCWKIMDTTSWGAKMVRYFKKGIGMVRYEFYWDDGILFSRETLINRSLWPKWLSLSDNEFSLDPNLSTTLKIAFDANELFPGLYESYVNFLDSNTDSLIFQLKAKLNVTGVPLISCPNVVGFDTVYSGYSTQRIFTIRNIGTEDLSIDSLVFLGEQFQADVSSGIISPNEIKTIQLKFSPSAEGSFTGVMKIYSNSFNDSLIEVLLKGEGMYPPAIDASKVELNFSVVAEGFIYDTITIRNIGQNRLKLTVSLVDKPDLNSFMPLKIGNEWNFISTNEYHHSIIFYDIESDPLINEYNYFLYSDAFNMLNSKHIEETWNGIRINDTGDVFNGHKDVYPDNSPSFYEHKIMDGEPFIGKKWSCNEWSENCYEIIKIEDAETPFGIIKNCWVVEYTVSLPQGHDMKFNLFWKEGIGLVKKAIIETTNFAYPVTTFDTILLTDYTLYGPEWLRCSHSAVSLLPSEQTKIIVEINPELINLEYADAYLKINSNDPETPELLIPVHVDLTISINSVKKQSSLKVYPNPVSSNATIDFNLIESENVLISVSDMSGRIIDVIAKSKMNAGTHQLEWNTSNLDKGVYLLQLQSAAGVEAQKLVVQ